MKKLFLLVLPFISVTLNAEQLRFVTVLSSPVGTFNRLEEVDPTVPVKSPVINFCTKLGNSGTVTLQGNKNPEVNTLSLSNGTILGGSGKDYILNKLTMKQGGTLKGSRLLANVMQVPNGGMGVSENLYSNNLTVAGAKTGKLYVNGSDAVIEEAWPADVTMVWSNEYQTDNACKDGNKCAGQYLLKQRGSSLPEAGDDDDSDKKMCIVKVEWREEEVKDSYLNDGRCFGANKHWGPSRDSSPKNCALGEECNCVDGEWVVVTGYYFDCFLYETSSDRNCFNKVEKRGGIWGKCRREDPHVCIPATTIPFKPGNISTVGVTSNCSKPGFVGSSGEALDKSTELFDKYRP